MGLNGIVNTLEHKSILITGSSGFLAKVFVEKVLRIQPNVKKLFLLLRATNAKSAAQRLHNEVIGKELFKVLKEKHGAGFNGFISSKVILVCGDISFNNLGLKDSNLTKQMHQEVDIVVNIAANTNFDERYDVTLGTNTLGPKHVLEFAKNCKKLEMLLHVSTAYVCGEKSGLILEKSFQMGETLNGTSGLDIEQEMKLIEEKLDELRSLRPTKEEETFAMKEFGLTRARHYGWPNTYVFTKAMGEMLIGKLRETSPVVIIRPTIVTSTFKEPFPGWMEGVRTIDSFGVAYGKGKLTCMLGDPETVLDLIPGDMVVNAMIVAMVINANQDSEIVYQIGSSISNAMNTAVLRDYGYDYFSKNPWINKTGKPVKVRKAMLFTTMDGFHKYVLLRYMIPLKGLQLVNVALCNFFRQTWSDLNMKVRVAMRLIDLFRPYLFFRGVFDDLNMERLRLQVRENEEEHIFYFDPKDIDWEDYFINTHLPGLMKLLVLDEEMGEGGGHSIERFEPN